MNYYQVKFRNGRQGWVSIQKSMKYTAVTEWRGGKKFMIISSDAEKAFDKTWNSFMTKTYTSRKRRTLPQHNKGYIWKPHNKHTLWWKTKSISATISNKAKMSAFSTSDQNSTVSSSKSNQVTNRNKSHPHWKGSKSICSQIWSYV